MLSHHGLAPMIKRARAIQGIHSVMSLSTIVFPLCCRKVDGHRGIAAAAYAIKTFRTRAGHSDRKQPQVPSCVNDRHPALRLAVLRPLVRGNSRQKFTISMLTLEILEASRARSTMFKTIRRANCQPYSISKSFIGKCCNG